MSDYELLRFSLPEELEELFTAELWSAGALGFEVREAEHGRLWLDAYFPSPRPAGASDRQLGRWIRRGVRLMSSKRLADQDWLASYRGAVEPFDIGRRFRIDPRDPDQGKRSVAEDRRFTLRIPAQTAFGTGSHASTRLVLEWLEELELADLEVLDVGTGSGILSFAAERLGAGRIVAFDVDAPSICIARANARLNAPLRGNVMMPRFFAGSLAALRPEHRFDLALVNILPENFAGQLPRLAGMLKPGGRVISSGNLCERREELLGRWQCRGFQLEAERRQDEWLAFLLAVSTGRDSTG